MSREEKEGEGEAHRPRLNAQVVYNELWGQLQV